MGGRVELKHLDDSVSTVILVPVEIAESDSLRGFAPVAPAAPAGAISR